MGTLKRLENLDNENGKGMEREKFTKSGGILLSVSQFLHGRDFHSFSVGAGYKYGIKPRHKASSEINIVPYT